MLSTLKEDLILAPSYYKGIEIAERPIAGRVVNYPLTTLIAANITRLQEEVIDYFAITTSIKQESIRILARLCKRYISVLLIYRDCKGLL